jgi:hypothetical protein
MTRALYALMLLSLCSGCASIPNVQPEQQVITRTEYLIKIPPAELLTLPPPVVDINVDQAEQSDVANWILQKEAYTRELEDKLTGIAAFFKTQQTEVATPSAPSTR